MRHRTRLERGDDLGSRHQCIDSALGVGGVGTMTFNLNDKFSSAALCEGHPSVGRLDDDGGVRCEPIDDVGQRSTLDHLFTRRH